ncbi:nodulation protein NfeD [Shewanella algae]|uniref:NfeD family protein n=1 Tax=Shewanella algae TaxID=38313 RepID=UPI00313BAD2A
MKGWPANTLFRRCGCVGLLALLWILPGLGADHVRPKPYSPAAAPTITLLSVKGAIGPGVGDYLIRGIESAAATPGSQLVLITLDTPGGLVSSLRDINQAILGSRVPVACLVYPSGARAASAGTYILYACHIAAMASATSLGAATPVQLGPMGNEPPEPKPSENEAEKPVGDSNSQKLERKQLNDAIAYIRALAELRQRNVEWAEKAVREAATLTASEALEANVIDYIADTPQQLLAILDGKSVAMQSGARILKTENAIVLDRSPDWRARFINLLTNPNIAYILMLLGIYGLLLEFYSPGAMLPGVIGGICLLLALYAFQLLPISYAGGGLLLLGITLLLAEAMLPSFGILGFGGLAAFVLGSVFLVDSEVEAFRIAWPVIALVSVVSLLFFLLLISFVFKTRKLSGVAGAEGMVGEYARVIEGFPGRGRVHFMGEDWQGDSEQALSPGQRVRVLGLKGLVLKLAEVKSGDIEPTENQRRGD